MQIYYYETAPLSRWDWITDDGFYVVEKRFSSSQDLIKKRPKKGGVHHITLTDVSYHDIVSPILVEFHNVRVGEMFFVGEKRYKKISKKQSRLALSIERRYFKQNKLVNIATIC